MAELSPGANTGLSESNLSVEIHLHPGVAVDVTALQLYPGGKVRGDGDMCFYGQQSISAGALRLQTGAAPRFDLDLTNLPPDLEKVVFTATIEGTQTFGQLGEVTLKAGDHRLNIPCQNRTEKALILAEVYKHNGNWKIRNVGQGFNGGLKALAEHFGMKIADDDAGSSSSAPPPRIPTSAPSPEPTKIILSKISLTKQEKSISLKKNDGKFGKIRINLNWNQKKKKTSLFGLGSNSIDLDLGAFVQHRDGRIDVVQALGNRFGQMNELPFMRLLGDDRTGASKDGEWIEINGDRWSDIKRILIYTFIYDGVANWRETDGVVRVLVAGQPEVEVRMNEYESSDRTCAIASLENRSGEIVVERHVKFFASTGSMDAYFGYGFRWIAGQK